MSNYRFDTAQRFAVYTAHSAKCYICERPIDLKSMQIDHVIPEGLPQDPGKFSDAIIALGLPPDFDVNSYENWLPTCPKCNNKKRGHVFRSTLLVQLNIEMARDKANLARSLEKETSSRQAIQRAIAIIDKSIDDSSLHIDDMLPLVEKYLFANDLIMIPKMKDPYLGFMMETRIPLTPGYAVIYVGGMVRPEIRAKKIRSRTRPGMICEACGNEFQ